MKPNWYMLLTGLSIGGGVSLITFVIFNYQFDADASVSDMQLAAVLGAALGGALTLIFANKSR
jgi:ABC-type cobalamin transport system permease subunit